MNDNRNVYFGRYLLEWRLQDVKKTRHKIYFIKRSEIPPLTWRASPRPSGYHWGCSGSHSVQSHSHSSRYQFPHWFCACPPIESSSGWGDQCCHQPSRTPEEEGSPLLWLWKSKCDDCVSGLKPTSSHWSTSVSMSFFIIWESHSGIFFSSSTSCFPLLENWSSSCCFEAISTFTLSCYKKSSFIVKLENWHIILQGEKSWFEFCSNLC